MMRYFTREWSNGELGDDESERVPGLYWAYVERLLPLLPLPVQDFSREVNLHDGYIQETVADYAARELQFRICCGDLQVGYYDVHLVYERVDFGGLDLPVLRAVVESPESEILYDELDTAPGGQFVHRVLYWPRDELSIVFGTMRFTKTPRDDRADRVGAGLREIPGRSGSI